MSEVNFGTPVDQVPGSLPTTFVPEDADLHSAVSFLSTALQAPTETHFTPDALWRDWLVCHDRVRTICSSTSICNDWNTLGLATSLKNLQMAPGPRILPSVACSWVSVGFTFNAQKGDLPLSCSGSAGVAWVDGSWKIFTLMTMTEQIDGHGNCDDPTLLLDNPNKTSQDQSTDHYGAVIIGAGWSGLSMAARLGALGIPYLVIEQLDEVGAFWSRRYEVLKLHTNREVNCLPFERMFSADDDIYISGKQLGKGMQKWAEKYNINVWLSSRVEQADRMESENAWSLKVVKNGQPVSLTTDNLIFATGSILQRPKRPAISGEADFKGKLMHAIEFKSAQAWQGKKVVIIGSGTQAHDVAKDMVDSGAAEVHMIQRSKTAVFPIQNYARFESMLFNREIPTEVSDRMRAGPDKHAQLNIDANLVALNHTSPTKELHDNLEKAGFRVDRDVGMIKLITERAGTYYLDVGASQCIVDGRIKVKSGVPISSFTPEGLAFADGTKTKADVIIYCTGYAADYHGQVEAVIGAGKMKGVPPFWGMDAEGESQGHLRDDVPGIWLAGGPAPQARLNSRFLALQIQMRRIKAGKLTNGRSS